MMGSRLDILTAHSHIDTILARQVPEDSGDVSELATSFLLSFLFRLHCFTHLCLHSHTFLSFTLLFIDAQVLEAFSSILTLLQSQFT